MRAPVSISRQVGGLPLSIWFNGDVAFFDNDQIGADRHGHISHARAGFTYAPTGNVMLGAYGRYGNREVSSNALAVQIEGQMFGGGAFASAKLPGDFTLAVGAAASRGDYESRIAGAFGDFATDEYQLSGRISRPFHNGLFSFTPSAAIEYRLIDRDAFTDTTGARIAGSELELGRFMTGLNVGYLVIGAGPILQPHAHLHWGYNFLREDAFRISPGVVVEPPGHSVTTGAGLNVFLAGGQSLALAGSYSYFDDGTNVWSGQVSGSIPLSALGIRRRSGGDITLSLQAAGGDETTATSRVRVRLPLE